MRSKELFKQTFVERHKFDLTVITLAVLFLGGLTGSLTIVFVFVSPIVGLAFNIIMIGLAVALTVRVVRNNLEQTVNLFIGDHKRNKFVELSLKYLGYETKTLDDNDKVKRNFIIVNDKHLVYTSQYNLSLGDLDVACKIAKEEDKSLTVILDARNDITSDAYAVAKQGGIIIHSDDSLYDNVYKTIKTKGGEPIRECLCT